MSEVKYKRILLKLSGEALAGDAHRGLDFSIINSVCEDGYYEVNDLNTRIDRETKRRYYHKSKFNDKYIISKIQPYIVYK